MQALTKKVQEEIDGIEIEKVKVKKANAALQRQIEESGMPEVKVDLIVLIVLMVFCPSFRHPGMLNCDAKLLEAQVLEYVTQKATAHQLAKDLSNWERKVEIGEMELRRLRTHSRRGTTGASMATGTPSTQGRTRFGGDPFAEPAKGVITEW